MTDLVEIVIAAILTDVAVAAVAMLVRTANEHDHHLHDQVDRQNMASLPSATTPRQTARERMRTMLLIDCLLVTVFTLAVMAHGI